MLTLKITLSLLILFFFSNAQDSNSNKADSKRVSENSQISIVIDTNEPMQIFGASKIEAALKKLNFDHRIIDKSVSDKQEQIILCLIDPSKETDIKKEGFRISESDNGFIVSAIDNSGAMYGLMDIAEQIEMNKRLKGIEKKTVNPRFAFRAIKFNLPWSGYRSREAILDNMELCKDLNMWRDFLDMMAENRFNSLTLWNLHPFPYLIRTKNFPEATPFSDAELAEWKIFWTALFKMAKERGVDTYIFNWNIIVSESFKENYGEGNTKGWADGYTSPQIEKYTRESVTQVINEYPDLTGFGITMGEAMNGWNAEQETEWIEKTFFAGIKVADRKVRFIYRAALFTDHNIHRHAIDYSGIDTPENPIIVEIKFNWSHGHSTPKLVKVHEGGTGKEYYTNPAPSHHKMGWMIRNEDFCRLRWGDPDFIRKHIQINGQDYVGGYFIGSESYIPAKDIYHIQNHPHVNWKYAFERQWLYYKEWGRLLYNPCTTDDVFINAFNQRYSGNFGEDMVRAYKLSTHTTQRIAGFFDPTWDYSFYAEGFTGNERDFITIKEMIDAEPIEPDFVSIKEYDDGSQYFGYKLTPIRQASVLEEDNRKALEIVECFLPSNETLKCEIADVKAWAYLGLYFAKKIRTAVALNQNKKSDAVKYITEAQQYWRDLVIVTEEHIRPSPLGHLKESKNFHWKYFQGDVDAEVDWVKNQ